MDSVTPFAYKAKMLLTGKIALLFTLVILLTELSASSYADDLVVNAEDSLEWNQKEAFYHATGNAEAFQGKQEIRAQSLKAFYDPKSVERTISRIIADGNVTFADENHKGRGKELDYDATSLTYLLKGPGAVISGPDGSGTAEQTIIFKSAAQLVELLENAEIQLRDGRHLSGQKIIIYLDDANNISRITAMGNVTIKQTNGSTATANKVDYNRAVDSALLTGNVVIKDGETELAGGRAKVDFATGVSKMLSDESGGRVSGRFTRLKE
jgi:lipopolysaccharide export system protein LptA